MLRGHTVGGAVRAAKHDRHVGLAARHVVGLGRRVDHVVDRLHRKVPRHELADRPQTGERGADGETGETHLGDGRVDDAVAAVLLKEAARDLVGALVLADLLANQKDGRVARHLLVDRRVERVTHGQLFRGGGKVTHGRARRRARHLGGRDQAGREFGQEEWGAHVERSR